jgi:protein arginine N-methyltransferase 2
MKNEVLIFSESSIKTTDNKTVMHRWEDPIMKRKSEWLCEQGGNILELGFGMGISANYIQSHNIKSHTICEINPYVLEKLYIWAENKPNVIVLEGDWFDRINDMEIYDGILFDTHNDKNITFFFT